MMDDYTSNLKLWPIAIVLILIAFLLVGLGVAICKAETKFFTDTTELTDADLPRANELKSDGVMATTAWVSAGRNVRLLIDRINNKNVFVTEGGIDIHQLMEDPNWTGQPPNINGSRTRVLDAGRKVNVAMLYYEYQAPNEHQPTLSVSELQEGYQKEGRTPILPLARNFVGTARDRIIAAMKLSKDRYPGVFWELSVDKNAILGNNIFEGLRYVRSVGRKNWIMLSGNIPSTNYAGDVGLICKWMKGIAPTAWKEAWVGVAAYTMEDKHIVWYDTQNSVEIALKVLRGNCG